MRASASFIDSDLDTVVAKTRLAKPKLRLSSTCGLYDTVGFESCHHFFGEGHPFMRPVIQKAVSRVAGEIVQQGLLPWDEVMNRLASWSGGWPRRPGSPCSAWTARA